MNKGKLCKKCFNDKFNDTQKETTSETTNGNDSFICDELEADRSMIDLIKGQLEKESQMNFEIIQILKDQVDHLKSEVLYIRMP